MLISASSAVLVVEEGEELSVSDNLWVAPTYEHWDVLPGEILCLVGLAPSQVQCVMSAVLVRTNSFADFQLLAELGYMVVRHADHIWDIGSLVAEPQVAEGKTQRIEEQAAVGRGS